MLFSYSLTYGQESGVDMETKSDFPEKHWDEIRAAMETGGISGLTEYIGRFADPEERRKLYRFAAGAFYSREWEGKSLDGYVGVARAAIDEGIRQAGDDMGPGSPIGFSDMMSYNLAADLADCWPGDDVPREERHFKEGLKAAEDCIEWRRRRELGPLDFSMAYWAKGIHELSLGLNRDSRRSFGLAYDYSVENAAAEGKSKDVSRDGDFFIILNAGYLGLAEIANGEPNGKKRYDEVIAAFKAQIDDMPDKKEDARFGIDQLEKTEGKYIK